GAPRPHRRRDQDRERRTARGRIPDLGRLRRILPQGVGGAGAVLCRKGAAVSRTQDSQAQDRRNRRAPNDAATLQRLLRFGLPVVVAAVGTGLWELVVRAADIPPYVLPAPSAILATLISDRDVLFQSLLTTLLTTLEGFLAASIGGILLALLFNL